MQCTRKQANGLYPHHIPPVTNYPSNQRLYLPALQGITAKPCQKTMILRHDVDKLPENALTMAQLEHSLGIQRSYFFRIIPEVFQPDIIQQIESLGQEVGSHYEDLRLAGEEVRKRLKNKETKRKEEVSSKNYEVGSDEEIGNSGWDTPLGAGGARGNEQEKDQNSEKPDN